MVGKIKLNISIEIDEKDLVNVSQKLFQLGGGLTASVITPQLQPAPPYNEKVLTSIRQIADYFKCSIPTAQKIKNSIPKDQYSQTGRTFAIPESLLIKANHHLNKEK